MNVLERLHPAGADQVGPDIGSALDFERQKPTPCIERQGRVGDVVARLMVGKQDLATGGDPFDRAPDPLCRPRDQHVLGIDEVLGAKAAADIGGDKPHRPRRHPERARRVIAGIVDALRRDVGGVATALRVPQPDDAARLHRVGDDPVVVEPQADHMRGRGERVVDSLAVAGPPVEA